MPEVVSWGPPTQRAGEDRARHPATDRAALLVALALCLLGALLPAAANAARLPPGVHVDPGSPAAKEYQIPLGAARGNGQATSSGSNQLFGAGITRQSGGGGPSAPRTAGAAHTSANHAPAAPAGAAARRHGRPATRKRGGGSNRLVIARPASAPSPARAIGTDAGAGIGITWMLGAAVVVLVLGGLGGAMLARRGRRTSPHLG